MPIGHVPQVESTFAYLDGSYGILNDQHLAIGESTCASVLVNFPVYAGGMALFDMSALTRIAMERCASARCAIKTMGYFAQQYGFYGAEWTGEFAQSEAGEALSIADKQEVWIFHVSPDGSNASAVWVAQRVNDLHVAAVTNDFIIREVNVSDTNTFLASDNLFEVAQAHGLWKAGEIFDFARVFSPAVRPVQLSYYMRRRWRVYSLVSGLEFDPWADYAQHPLPFSVPAKSLLTVADLKSYNRDYFQNTSFDLSKGLAAGPYGDPNRYDKPGAY